MIMIDMNFCNLKIIKTEESNFLWTWKSKVNQKLRQIDAFAPWELHDLESKFRAPIQNVIHGGRDVCPIIAQIVAQLNKSRTSKTNNERRSKLTNDFYAAQTVMDNQGTISG